MQLMGIVSRKGFTKTYPNSIQNLKNLIFKIPNKLLKSPCISTDAERSVVMGLAGNEAKASFCGSKIGMESELRFYRKLRSARFTRNRVLPLANSSFKPPLVPLELKCWNIRNLWKF
ncbi:hypothetical protein CCY99_07645 [Helicobacter sp. 16-1353]|nr:hypothetical protein CCY99_07645 [Helicobacter sp. 16-1353]